MAGSARGDGSLVANRPDVPPLVQARCVGAAAAPGADKPLNRAKLGMTFLGGTDIHAYQKAAAAVRKRTRSFNGMIVRRWAGSGAALAPELAWLPTPSAEPLPSCWRRARTTSGLVPSRLWTSCRPARWMVADRGYSSKRTWSLGTRSVISTRRNEGPPSRPSWIYTNRNQVERLLAKPIDGVGSSHATGRRLVPSRISSACCCTQLDQELANSSASADRTGRMNLLSEPSARELRRLKRTLNTQAKGTTCGCRPSP